MPVRKTGQLPENIDRQVNEIIRAFSEMEEQVRQIRKASDTRIGDNAEYIDRHVRNLNNPHSVTAKQVKALPLAFVLDPSSIYFPFQNSLVSTRGASPIGLYGSSITDYGLVTGSDLCATLLPEGGVAVAEGTTNIYKDASEFPGAISDGSGTLTVEEYFERYNGNKVMRLIKTEGEPDSYTSFGRGISIDPDSFYTLHCKAKMVYGGDIQDRFGCRWKGAGSNWEQIIPLGNGWFHCIRTFSPAGVDSSNMGFRVKGNSAMEVLVTEPQLEPMPYDTPFVEGTRPAGALSYNLPISINGDWTIAKWLELEPYFMELNYNNNGVWKCPVLSLGTGYGSSGQGLIGLYGAWVTSDAGKTITFVIDKEGDRLDTRKITLNEEEYNDKIFAVIVKQDTTLTAHLFTSARHHTMEYDISSLGDLSVIKPQFYLHANIVAVNRRMYCKRHLNTLVCPYAVSPETIATWHSLDAPFIDPFIPPSQGVPYFNTPGEFINSTANFAMVNVDGLVKLYARTPDKTIIIEILGNTEVV